jgi:hypothetical protein
MENLKSKEFYLQRKAEQLRQWERVIDKLTSRADNAEDKNKTNLHHHIAKIQVQKARTMDILEQLQKAENENWDNFKINLEKSWTDLREAFLKASARPNKNKTTV